MSSGEPGEGRAASEVVPRGLDPNGSRDAWSDRVIGRSVMTRIHEVTRNKRSPNVHAIHKEPVMNVTPDADASGGVE
jgi:hypothetical protein